ncbi:winged helix-turn-helix transcriptional regulator [Candidatus Woesearchaeota archaeon]|nr:MAG: regulatory protein ArsR [archaeon GW2011_AR4]MBS3129067.1 winged helix-turn-helix transcriptional regulator [Candidatus Woesearchaeota archaeon]HIH37801.1 winged helix-turn-helix transcriptional regulator [Candidatus Woesearchaeota archaeon]HIH48425.1 winged helix-turn-helix transcriptional regulator [Candidatus Woesearchaeota archaeon]HIJ03926.1 winged helix-turn-helix transcriptional regulator [Candidatus Woesearchaeota archaeon]
MAKQESFVLVNLNEEKTKDLAKVLANETTRKILNLLTQGEKTATEIAQQLQIPLSTVTYNIGHLMAVKLVVVEEFHYSEKGREVPHYKLANKCIIIAPENPPETMMKKIAKLLPSVFGIALGGILLKVLGSRSITAVGAPMAKSLAQPAQDLAMMEAAPAAARSLSSTQIPPASTLVSPDAWVWFIIGALITLLLISVARWWYGRKTS